MISYRREPSHDYTMFGACAVIFEGGIHFFGGFDEDLTRQHFVIETQRSGQLVKMTKKKDLKIEFFYPSCSTFEMTGEHFPWFRTNVVILCFVLSRMKTCHWFDGKLHYVGDSNYLHLGDGLTKYKEGLLTVGDYPETEILIMNENKNFSWSVVEPDYKIDPTGSKGIHGYSLVTVESSDINEEYVLLIGGKYVKDVFKFNGTWFSLGQLNKPRFGHNSIYWNGAVYVIGGEYNFDFDNDSESSFFESFFHLYDRHEFQNTKMEIWNIKDSQGLFKTNENWPELDNMWRKPHLFIVPDSFFPD